LKDNFSKQASTYKKFRPTYPPKLYDFLLEHCERTELLWDVGTGNGQAAFAFAPYFKKVIATDISDAQLKNAKQADNITYKLSNAENSNLETESVDLITVAQAIHWFDFKKFEKEAKRVLRPGGILAYWGYGLLSIDGINSQIQHFYKDIIGPYWDEERKHIEAAYESIEVSLDEEIGCPALEIETKWNKNEFFGYLNSWSSVQHYLKKENKNPVDIIAQEIENVWYSETKEVLFPLFLKMFKKE
jgi:ubiquinone/menaquinone biosynthesis C-methylase UbiE